MLSNLVYNIPNSPVSDILSVRLYALILIERSLSPVIVHYLDSRFCSRAYYVYNCGNYFFMYTQLLCFGEQIGIFKLTIFTCFN